MTDADQVAVLRDWLRARTNPGVPPPAVRSIQSKKNAVVS